MSLDIIATSGSAAEKWAVEDVSVPAGQTVEIEIPKIEELSELTWAHYGVPLSIRVEIFDEETGNILDFGSAPERWVWFEQSDWALLLGDEVVELLGGGDPEEGEIVVAVLPPGAVHPEVE